MTSRIVRLGDICEITYGTSAPTVADGTVPVIGMQHIREGKLDLSALPSCAIDEGEVEKLRLRPGDILFNRTNSLEHVGKSALFRGNGDSPTVFASYLVRLRSDSRQVVPAFLAEVLAAPSGMRQIKAMATQGVQQCNVNPSRLAAYFSLRLPALDEQATVVALAARLDAVKEQTRSSVEAKRRLKRALLQQLLHRGHDAGWPRHVLSSVVEINPSPRRARAMSPKSDVSFVPMASVAEGGGFHARAVATRRIEEVARGYTAFEEGDVLVAKITPCFENGKGALATGLTNGVGFGSTEFHVARCGENLRPGFLFHITQSWAFRQAGRAHMTGSAGQKRVPTEFLEQWPTLVPPLAEQDRIVRLLGFCDREIALLERQLAAYRQLKRGLMQQLLASDSPSLAPSS